jgi:hypothetical protein
VVCDRDSFLNALVKWLATSYGLAILPFLAKLLGRGPYEAEFCLFLLVLGASGLFEAAFRHERLVTRTILAVVGLSAVVYGAFGYADLSGGQPFPPARLLWWGVWVLSASYLAYKVPVLWRECHQV